MVTKGQLRQLKRSFFERAPLTPHEKVAGTLASAAKLIDERGWVRGALCTEAGYCVVGAIIASDPDVEVQELAFDRVREVVGRPHVSPWNDEPDRTKKEVLDALKRARERARLLFMLKEPKVAGPDRSSIYS